MKEIKVVLKAKAGENGKLFGSVTSKDVAEALTSQHHIKLDKKKFVMPDGIKTLGTTTVDVKILGDPEAESGPSLAGLQKPAGARLSSDGAADPVPGVRRCEQTRLHDGGIYRRCR